MKIANQHQELKQHIQQWRADNKIIGFVPTMGALHQGHISLVEEAQKESDVVVVSIFVNPTQFNNPEDLEKYPRNLERDIELLQQTNCALLFAPDVDVIYPNEDKRTFDFGNLATVMEGKHRPGHFNGVGQVVSRLFEMVQPHKAFFGLKDFQQLAIVNHLVTSLKSPVEIIGCPIIREKDGLAMSSRNQRLSPKVRKNAPAIAQSLFDSLNFAAEKTVAETIQTVVDQINQTPHLRVEYFDIVDGLTLQRVDKWDDSDYIVGCIAVFADTIRLIDNVTYKNIRHEY
jgi:pantoate--beta-alanine ligase